MTLQVFEHADKYLEGSLSEKADELVGHYYAKDSGGGDVDVAAITLAFASGGAAPSGYHRGDACPVSGFSGLYCVDVKITPNPKTLKQVEVDVTWSAPVGGDEEDWQMDGASQQIHITHVPSPADQRHYPSYESCGTAIGINGDSVDGVDIYAWAKKLTITKHFHTLAAYIAADQAAEAVANSLNSGAWYNWASRSVLFIGAKGGKKAPSDWVLDYNFLIMKFARPTSITLSDGSTLVFNGVGGNPSAILPWDHVTYSQEKIEYVAASGDPAAGPPQNGIKAVHIATLYKNTFSYAALGLRSGPN